MGDGLGGGRMGITIKQPLTAHTTPEQLPDELRWRGLGVWGALRGLEGGVAAEEQQGTETCTLSRTDSAVERHVNHQGYYWRGGHGTLQLSETPHWLLHDCS